MKYSSILAVLICFAFSSICSFALASAPDMESWKKGFIKRAAKQGLPKEFTQKQLDKVGFDESIIDKDRNQVTLDTTIEFREWIVKWMRQDPDRISMGKEKLKQHSELLEKIEKKYQVEKEVIVSLWGVETLFGKITGNYDIISALATLAADTRRPAFFEAELIAALKILHQGHINREDFQGSWAGAMGQCQFMPTSFMRYAQDFNGDGKKDIWNEPADIFASIAHYLKSNGWQYGKTIGTLAYNTKNKQLNLDRMRGPSQYKKLGFESYFGGQLSGHWRRRLATIPHKNSPLVLRGSNYETLLRWNRSSLFAALNIIMVEGLR